MGYHVYAKIYFEKKEDWDDFLKWVYLPQTSPKGIKIYKKGYTEDQI